MSKLRAVLEQLPFVAKKPNGTLDLWVVTPTGDTQKDLMMGRQYFAWLLHVMREFDAPFLLSHLHTAWHQKNDNSENVRQGLALEMSDTLCAADPGCPQIKMATADYRPVHDLREAMLKLPFVSERPDGSLNCFDVKWDGDFSDVQARGRHYAALTAKFLRDTRHPSFLGFVAHSIPVERAGGDLMTGYLTTLVEIAATASQESTVNQRSTLPLFEEAMQVATGVKQKGLRTV